MSPAGDARRRRRPATLVAGRSSPAGDRSATGVAPKTARRIRQAGAAGPSATGRRRGAVSTLLRQSGMRAFHWWRSGNKKRTQNVSEYMLVLALCLVNYVQSSRCNLILPLCLPATDLLYGTRHTASTKACTRHHFTFALCCHSNATRAPIANPPNSAQLGGIPYHSSKLHPGPCNSVGMWPRTDRQTDTHTDARDHNTFRIVYDSREM